MYIHAEGYAAGELKHGAIAPLQPGSPCRRDPHRFEAVREDARERRGGGPGVRRRSSWLRKATNGAVACRRPVRSAATKPLLTPILDTVPLQLLAYYIAKERALPDKPRNSPRA